MKVAALLFHDVFASDEEVCGFDGPIASRYKLPQPRFVEALDALSNVHPFRPVLVNELSLFEADIRAGFLPFLLTFDDGGASACRIAEELEARNWRGHFFITTGRIGTSGFVSKADIRRLHAAGHVVGSHSHSHPNAFGALPFDKQLTEWLKSRNELEDILGVPVVAASVPGGVFDSRVAESASAAGYEYLFTSEPVLELAIHHGCKVFGRFTIKDSTSTDEIVGFSVGNPIHVGRQFVVWNGKKALKRLSYPVYRRMSELLNRRR